MTTNLIKSTLRPKCSICVFFHFQVKVRLQLHPLFLLTPLAKYTHMHVYTHTHTHAQLMNRWINNEPNLETQYPWGTKQSINDIPTWVQMMSTYKLEMSLKKTNYSTVLTLGLSDGLRKPQHGHMHSLAPNPAPTSPPACDITTRVTSPVSGLTHHCLPIATHKVPFDPLPAPLIALRPPACLPMATRKCQGCGHREQGAIKRQWPTSCFCLCM